MLSSSRLPVSLKELEEAILNGTKMPTFSAVDQSSSQVPVVLVSNSVSENFLCVLQKLLCVRKSPHVLKTIVELVLKKFVVLSKRLMCSSKDYCVSEQKLSCVLNNDNDYELSCLLNNGYKFATKAILFRIESVLPKINHSSIRTITDIMSFTKSQNIFGLTVVLDFEKSS